MKRVFCAALAAAFLCACLLSGCTESKKEPVTLTMWHVYGNQTDSPMNDLVEEFNRTVGQEKGITISVTSVSSTNSINTSLVASTNKEPGAGELPDLFFSYLSTAKLMGLDILLDWNKYFGDAERAQYITTFMEEGEVDGKQIVFPVAKSSMVSFVNKTEFDRFSADTGVTLDDLLTWEGMFEVCAKYYNWSGGKAFLAHDNLLSYLILTTTQLGGQVYNGDTLNFNDPALKKIWDLLAVSAAAGHITMQDGYGTTFMMTGEVICNIGSTAGILYQSDTVTWPDGAIEPLELVVLPYPVMRGADSAAIQQGVGLCALAGSNDKEAAAAEFARWLTEKTVNTKFCEQTGYMPVRNDAFAAFLDGGLERVENPRMRSLFAAFTVMHRDYTFHTMSFTPVLSDISKDRRVLLYEAQEAGDVPQTAAAEVWAYLRNEYGK
jgi:multiple sugar transport system substrate-binding protein